jgi:predicted RND superfamily exporter protein
MYLKEECKMLSEKDLQAIAQLMDEKLTQQKAEIMHEVKALLEVDVLPKFGTLTAGHDLIIQKMVEQEDLDEVREDVENRLDVLEAAVKLHSHEIAKLKKAQ